MKAYLVRSYVMGKVPTSYENFLFFFTAFACVRLCGFACVHTRLCCFVISPSLPLTTRFVYTSGFRPGSVSYVYAVYGNALASSSTCKLADRKLCTTANMM